MTTRASEPVNAANAPSPPLTHSTQPGTRRPMAIRRTEVGGLARHLLDREVDGGGAARTAPRVAVDVHTPLLTYCVSQRLESFDVDGSGFICRPKRPSDRTASAGVTSIRGRNGSAVASPLEAFDIVRTTWYLPDNGICPFEGGSAICFFYIECVPAGKQIHSMPDLDRKANQLGTQYIHRYFKDTAAIYPAWQPRSELGVSFQAYPPSRCLPLSTASFIIGDSQQ
jgi:hypothetical protein